MGRNSLKSLTKIKCYICTTFRLEESANDRDYARTIILAISTGSRHRTSTNRRQRVTLLLLLLLRISHGSDAHRERTSNRFSVISPTAAAAGKTNHHSAGGRRMIDELEQS
jgi:hypothetical protein